MVKKERTEREKQLSRIKAGITRFSKKIDTQLDKDEILNKVKGWKITDLSIIRGETLAKYVYEKNENIFFSESERKEAVMRDLKYRARHSKGKEKGEMYAFSYFNNFVESNFDLSHTPEYGYGIMDLFNEYAEKHGNRRALSRFESGIESGFIDPKFSVYEERRAGLENIAREKINSELGKASMWFKSTRFTSNQIIDGESSIVYINPEDNVNLDDIL